MLLTVPKAMMEMHVLPITHTIMVWGILKALDYFLISKLQSGVLELNSVRRSAAGIAPLKNHERKALRGEKNI